GTTSHRSSDMFADASNPFLLPVPYPAAGTALTDTLGGPVDMGFPTPAAALPHVKAGTLRALAVTGAERFPLLPDVPTLREAGLKDFQFSQWLALLAPARTPPEIVTRLNAALRNTLGSQEVRDKFQAQAFEPYITTPEEAGKFIAAEAQRFSKLIKARKITAE